jgi:hypothetical protein
MATEITGGEAVLALAREFRHAISDRQEMMQKALCAYDDAVGDRFDHAAKFLRATQRADSVYESSSQVALERFHARIEESDRR